MGGSATVSGHRWAVWNQRQAIVTGRTALRGPCAVGGKSRGPCTGQNALYRTRATVRLDDAQPCVDQGVTLRYFGRATFRAFMRADNPFGYRTGWHTDTWKTDTFRGQCMLYKEGTFYGHD
jgi:hypothetical protein